MLPEKHMIPELFTGKTEKWRDWSEETSNLFDMKIPGVGMY